MGHPGITTVMLPIIMNAASASGNSKIMVNEVLYIAKPLRKDFCLSVCLVFHKFFFQDVLDIGYCNFVTLGPVLLCFENQLLIYLLTYLLICHTFKVPVLDGVFKSSRLPHVTINTTTFFSELS